MRRNIDMLPLLLLLVCIAAGPATRPSVQSSSGPLGPTNQLSALTVTEHLASAPRKAPDPSEPSRPDYELVIPMKVPTKFLDAVAARANLGIADFNTLAIQAASETDGRKMILLTTGISGVHWSGALVPASLRATSYNISPEIHASYPVGDGCHMTGEIRYTFPRDPPIVFHAKFDAHVKLKSNVGWSGMHPVSADITWSGVWD